MAVIMPPPGGDVERRSPWGLEPDRLWSLLDVIERYALLFAQALQALSGAKATCALHSMNDVSTKEAREKVSLAALNALHLCRIACARAGLTQVVPELDRIDFIRVSFLRDEGSTVKNLSSAIHHLRFRIQDELSSEFFVHVPRVDLGLYGRTELFGQLVSKHFPNSASDIEAAGSCLALKQPTACVFHLMRVMERGVQTLGKKLKVQINPEVETWNKVLDHVDKQIKALPVATVKQKSKKARFAEVSSYLHQTKIAWRNEVMHPKATYTQEEARDVFFASRAFMNHLSEVL